MVGTGRLASPEAASTISGFLADCAGFDVASVGALDDDADADADADDLPATGSAAVGTSVRMDCSNAKGDDSTESFCKQACTRPEHRQETRNTMVGSGQT